MRLAILVISCLALSTTDLLAQWNQSNSNPVDMSYGSTTSSGQTIGIGSINARGVYPANVSVAGTYPYSSTVSGMYGYGTSGYYSVRVNTGYTGSVGVGTGYSLPGYRIGSRRVCPMATAGGQVVSTTCAGVKQHRNRQVGSNGSKSGHHHASSGQNRPVSDRTVRASSGAYGSQSPYRRSSGR